MNSFIFLATVISLANASLMGQTAGMGGMFGYGYGMSQYPGIMQSQGMTPNPPNQGMQQMGMMGPQYVRDTAGVEGMGSSGMVSGGLCNSLCRGQIMMNQNTNQMIQTAQQNQMMKIMNNMMETLSQQTGPGMNMQQLNIKADQLAEQITQQYQQAEQAQMQQIVQEIQRQPERSTMMTGLGSMMLQRMAQQQAMNQMRKTLTAMQNQGNLMMDRKNNMTKTLQVALMAEMAMQSIQNQQSIAMPTMFNEKTMGGFRNQIQQLVEEMNILQTQATLAEYQIQAKQIRMQQQFLTQQMQKVQMYELLMAQQQGQVSSQISQSMQEAQRQMYQQQEQLMAEQLAQQMITRSLQQVLMSQENLLEEMSVQQAQTQMINPTMYMSSAGMMQA